METREFWKMYTEYGKAIKKVLYEYESDHDTIEDLFHDTFARALDAFKGFNGDSTIGTWLVHVAESVGKDHVKAMQADKRKNEVLECYLDPSTDEDGEFEVPYYDSTHTSTYVRESTENLDPLAEVEAEDVYEAAMGTLSPQQKAIVRLRREGYSNPEIAERLSSTEANVRYQVSSAARKMQEFTNNQQFISSNGISERNTGELRLLSQSEVERAQRQRVRAGLYRAVRKLTPHATLSEWKGMYYE
jgi:RNA polymerase sigma factor (sigma-70 family)